ncbi:MAG: hypothetical protein CVU80_01010 [Elusimicrobia bacterium HGW-Elusimicrobia-4]|nr:MAG: hypothetical protein CVU80_01010 [Elusimicrobia bacterium HGW-Elusimicrobia-4]
MKILQIIDIPWNSGITNYALELSVGLSRKGHRIFFAGVKDGLPVKLAKENGFETTEICSRKNPFIFGTILRLVKFIQLYKIDIVNAHTGKGHLLAYLALLFSNKKFAIIRTKADAMFPKKSFLYKKTKKIIAASEFIRKRYLKIGIEPEKVVTIYQGIDTSNYKLQITNYKLQTVGIVGRLDPVKGHRYFLEAAEIVLKKFPNAKFLIAGKEENIKYKELEQLAEKLGIQKSVEFFGYVENVYDFMSKCTLGIIASTCSEAVSRVLLEWMVCGKPVVATLVGCIPEIVDNEFLVLPEDAKALAEKILWFLENTEKILAVGLKNRRIIEQKLGMKDFVNNTERVYRKSLCNQ